jgi:Concanavalin A-like lectin/glucanases superfamily
MNTLVASLALSLSLLSCGLDLSAQENYVLQFDGVNDFVDMGGQIGGGVRTIECWFRASSGFNPNTPFPGYSLIVRNDAAQLHEYGMYMRGTDWFDGLGHLYFFMRDNGALHEISTNADTWVTGQWYHLCGTISATEGMKLYVNGELQVQTDPSGTVAIASSSEITAFGAWGDASIRYAGTQLDEVRFWNRALDQQEIMDRMCYQLVAADETGLVGYWPMNEGGGSILNDMSGLGNNGQIVSATYLLESNCVGGFFGLEEHAIASTMTALPNPWIDVITLTSTRTVDNGRLDLINNLGECVRSISGLNGSSFTLDRGSLSCGLYTISLFEGGVLTGSVRAVVAEQ